MGGAWVSWSVQKRCTTQISKNVMHFNAISCSVVFVPHTKPHVVKGLSKHYHLRLDPRLGNGKCSII